MSEVRHITQRLLTSAITSTRKSLSPSATMRLILRHSEPRLKIKLVLVNPCHIKKSREMDDSNLNKNDLKNPKMIVSVDK